MELYNMTFFAYIFEEKKNMWNEKEAQFKKHINNERDKVYLARNSPWFHLLRSLKRENDEEKNIKSINYLLINET